MTKDKAKGCDIDVWQRALEAPAQSAQPPPPRPGLTPSQKATFAAIIKHFSSPDFSLPGDLRTWRANRNTNKKAVKSDAWKPLNEVEKCFLSEEAIARFCRATKWDTKASISRAEETLVWRREYGVDELEAEEVEEESRTGKQFTLGYDNHGRPCLHMYPYRQNTKVSPRQIRFVVWCLERTIDLMPAGIDSLCLMIDFGGSGVKGAGGQPTTLGQAKQVLTILQTYYGERLGRAVCVNVHWLFWGFYKMVGPLVDPVTKEKIRFNPSKSELDSILPKEQREKKCFNGGLDFVYDHESYFPKLVELAKERRASMLQRWRQYGNVQVGMSERVLRGEDPNSRVPIMDAPSLLSNLRTESYVSTMSNTPAAITAPNTSNSSSASTPVAAEVAVSTVAVVTEEDLTPPHTPELSYDSYREGSSCVSDDGAISETTTHVQEELDEMLAQGGGKTVTTEELVQEGLKKLKDFKLSADEEGHTQPDTVALSRHIPIHA